MDEDLIIVGLGLGVLYLLANDGPAVQAVRPVQGSPVSAAAPPAAQAPVEAAGSDGPYTNGIAATWPPMQSGLVLPFQPEAPSAYNPTPERGMDPDYIVAELTQAAIDYGYVPPAAIGDYWLPHVAEKPPYLKYWSDRFINEELPKATPR